MLPLGGSRGNKWYWNWESHSIETKQTIQMAGREGNQEKLKLVLRQELFEKVLVRGGRRGEKEGMVMMGGRNNEPKGEGRMGGRDKVGKRIVRKGGG